MSYTPTTWQTGDTITAEKLNNMKAFVVNTSTGTVGGKDALICDKNGADVLSAAQNGPVVFLSSKQEEDSGTSYQWFYVEPLIKITRQTTTIGGEDIIRYTATTYAGEFVAVGNENLYMLDNPPK